MNTKKASVGIALMISAVFLYSLKDSFVKMTGGYYPAAQIIWMQYVATGTVFLVISYTREGRAVFRPNMPLLQILRGAFAAAGMGLFYWAITLPGFCSVKIRLKNPCYLGWIDRFRVCAGGKHRERWR